MPAPRPITPGLFTTTDAGPRLIVGRCPQCRRSHFPANPTCPFCGATGSEREFAGPAGRLWLYTTVTSRPPGYRGAIPYGFGLVELPDGLRVVSRLTEHDVSALSSGQRMTLCIDEVMQDEDGTPVLSYAFRPEAG